MLFLQKKGPLTLEHKEEGPVEAIPEHPERPLTQEWERGAATSQVLYRGRTFSDGTIKPVTSRAYM